MKRYGVSVAALLFALVTPLTATPAAEGNFAAGVAAYEAKNYKKAFDEWIVLARKNDPAAMRNIGHMYRRGLGVEQDFQKAMTWYMRAATLGFDRAQANVAGMFLAGEGVEQDYAQAANWFAQAAQQGHVISQYNLALLLENGLGVRKDERMALGWYAIAASAGHPESARKAAALSEKLNITIEDALNMSGEIVLTPKKKEAAEAAPAAEPEFPPRPVQPAPKVAAASAGDVVEKPAKPVQKKGFYEAIRSLIGGKEQAATAAAANTGEAAASQAAETEAETDAPERIAAADPAAAGNDTGAASDTDAVMPAPQSAKAGSGAPTPVPSKLARAAKPEVAAVPMGKVAAASVPPPAVTPPPGITPYGDGLSTAERLEMAELAYQLKQYQTSLGIWAQLAEEGNAEAQYRLGMMFNAGQAVPKDRVRAYYWWDRARSNGSDSAAAALAELEPTLTQQEKRQIDRVN